MKQRHAQKTIVLEPDDVLAAPRRSPEAPPQTPDALVQAKDLLPALAAGFAVLAANLFLGGHDEALTHAPPPALRRVVTRRWSNLP